MSNHEPFGIDRETWNQTVLEIRNILRDRARKRQLITYSELAEKLTHVTIEPPYHPLYWMLGEISTTEHNAGRPLLSAIVVRRDDNMPGNGFFELADELGYDISDDTLFWADQLKKVFSEHNED
ncbi:MAG TPA: hypothetical protein VNN20_05050 [Thermodesulfobacteriota bacterium]|nr:hypothetical protein [Thermodesulfobacteriota bacterium]